MAKNLQIVFLLSVALMVPSVSAVIISYGTYAPSDANQFSNANCGNDPRCPDSNYTTVTEAVSILGDNSVLAASQVNLRNTTGSNAQMVSASWLVDVSALSGNYSLFILPVSQPSSFLVIPYMNETHVETDLSTWQGPFTVTSNTLRQFDVTEAVQTSYDNLGYVKLRFFGVETAVESYGEIYLATPPDPASFQVIAQGVSQAEINTMIATEWQIFSPSLRDLTVSNMSCQVSAMNKTVVANSSYFTYEYFEDPSGRHAEAEWFANSSIFLEGQNYEVLCNMDVNGIPLINIEQYVYINRQSSMGSGLATLLQSISYLLGFQKEPIKIDVIPEFVSSSTNTNIVTSVMKGFNPVVGNSSTCRITVIDSLANVVVNNQSQSVFGAAALGMFNYSMNSTIGVAPYTVRSTCLILDATGSLNNYTGVGTLNPSLLTASEIYEGTPQLTLLSQVYVPGVANQVLAQLFQGSSSVTNANCNLTLYQSNFTKVFDNAPMTFSGEDGLYYRNWTPTTTSLVSLNFPARVSCSGGALGTKTIQASSSMEVRNGVVMQSVT